MLTETTGVASLTALHLALGVFRRHRAAGRSAFSPFVLPSFLFTVAPWLWPSPAGLALGLAAHLVWLLLCERIAPAARRTPPGTVEVGHGREQSRGAVPAPATPAPGFITTSVLAVLDEAAGIRTFRMVRPSNFEFRAGQFVPVRVQIDGRPHVRCYSISSPPHVRGYFEISVRRQGLVSGALHGTLRAGATLTVGPPAGMFIYPDRDDRPLAFIAGGIGITPLLAMAEHAAASDPTRPVTLLYSVRGEHDIAFRDALQLLAARHPHLRVVITLTDHAGPSRFHVGRIDAPLLRQQVPASADTLFYLCGPPQMVTHLRDTLGSMGVPDAQIRFERFDLAAAATLVNGAEHVHPHEGAPSTVQVTFESSHRTVTARCDRTLLETAEAEGVAMTSVCRAGVCLSCRTRLTSGTADCESSVLDPEDRAAGFILPCVTRPTSDCVMEA